MGKENLKLKQIYSEKGITTCEMTWPHECWYDNGLSFAHRHKRIHYKSCKEKLSDFNETLLLCPVAHSMIEYDRELTKKLFKELRSNYES